MYIVNHDQKQTHISDGSTLKVGRAPSSDIVCDDKSASRFHSELKVEKGQLSYRDLESTNGSMLNGRRVKAWDWQPVGDGDLVEIGKWRASIERSSDAPAEKSDQGLNFLRPSVDPSAPSSTYEVTGKVVIPKDLIKEQ